MVDDNLPKFLSVAVKRIDGKEFSKISLSVDSKITTIMEGGESELKKFA